MALDPNIILRGSAMQQEIQQQNNAGLQKLIGTLGQIGYDSKVRKMRQLTNPEDQQAFANNSLFANKLNTQLAADRAAAAKAAADQLKFNADLTKTYGEIGKIGAETGEIDAKAGKITTETGITRQNNTGNVWNAYLTGGVNAAKALLESMKANGTIDENAYKSELTQLTNVEALPDAAQKQNYALGRYRGTIDPKYSLPTTDNDLDNKTQIGGNSTVSYEPEIVPKNLMQKTMRSYEPELVPREMMVGGASSYEPKIVPLSNIAGSNSYEPEIVPKNMLASQEY